MFGEASGTEEFQDELPETHESYLPEVPLFVWGEGQELRVAKNALSEAVKWYGDSRGELLNKKSIMFLSTSS